MVLSIRFNLYIPEDGELIAETCSRYNLMHYLVSVMYVSLIKQQYVLTQRYTVLLETQKLTDL
jgi:hypothetical protein